MCIIMSLNVNEMELKDPKRRTCGMLHKERKGWGGGNNSIMRKKIEEKMSRLCSFVGT